MVAGVGATAERYGGGRRCTMWWRCSTRGKGLGGPLEPQTHPGHESEVEEEVGGTAATNSSGEAAAGGGEERVDADDFGQFGLLLAPADRRRDGGARGCLRFARGCVEERLHGGHGDDGLSALTAIQRREEERGG
jgi:hypothetical protein